MAFQRIKAKLARVRYRRWKQSLFEAPDKCGRRLSKYLRYDTEVPGDRGACTQSSLCEGSE